MLNPHDVNSQKIRIRLPRPLTHSQEGVHPDIFPLSPYNAIGHFIFQFHLYTGKRRQSVLNHTPWKSTEMFPTGLGCPGTTE